MKRWWLFLCALVLMIGWSEQNHLENLPAPEPKPPEEQPDRPGKTCDSRLDRVVYGDTLHLKEPVLGSTKAPCYPSMRRRPIIRDRAKGNMERKRRRI